MLTRRAGAQMVNCRGVGLALRSHIFMNTVFADAMRVDLRLKLLVTGAAAFRTHASTQVADCLGRAL